MKILVTGYSGFLGRHVGDLLAERGHSIRVILHSTAIRIRDFNPAFEVVWGSMEDPQTIRKAVSGVDAVVHCAWIWPKQLGGNSSANLDIVTSIWEACRLQGVLRFAFISSVAVYGMQRRKEPLCEESMTAQGRGLKPDYPRNKIEAERFLLDQPEDGLQSVIFRPGIIFDDQKGPARKLNLAGRSYLLGFGSGRNRLPFIHAADVAQAVLLWLEKGSPRRIYNVTPSTLKKRREWFKTWGLHHQAAAKPLFVPKLLMRGAGLGIWALKRLMGKKGKTGMGYVLASATRDLRYSNDALRADLGWRDACTEAYWQS